MAAVLLMVFIISNVYQIYKCGSYKKWNQIFLLTGLQIIISHTDILQCIVVLLHEKAWISLKYIRNKKTRILRFTIISTLLIPKLFWQIV
jgi:hypothetical protein